MAEDQFELDKPIKTWEMTVGDVQITTTLSISTVTGLYTLNEKSIERHKSGINKVLGSNRICFTRQMLREISDIVEAEPL